MSGIENVESLDGKSDRDRVMTAIIDVSVESFLMGIGVFIKSSDMEKISWDILSIAKTGGSIEQLESDLFDGKTEEQIHELVATSADEWNKLYGIAPDGIPD